MLWFGMVSAAVVVGIIAVIYNLDQLFFVAVTVAGVPWLSWYLSNRGMTNVRAVIQSAGQMKLQVGETRTLRLVLYNHGRLPRVLCRAGLDLPPGLREVEGDSPQVDTLGPGGSTRLDVGFRASRRGHYRIRDAELRTTDLMGVFEFAVKVPNTDIDVVVWPRVLPVRNLDWLGEEAALAETRPVSSHRRGSGTEFYGVRPYVEGDELRRVHWPSTARHGELTVVQFEHSFSGAVSIIVDLRKGRHEGDGKSSTLEWSACFAATLASAALRSGRRVRLFAHGGKDCTVAPREGVAELEPILDALAAASADGEESLDAVVRRNFGLLSGTSPTLITPSIDASVRSAVGRLVSAGGTPTTLVVRPSTEAVDAQAAGARGMVFRYGTTDPVALLEAGP